MNDDGLQKSIWAPRGDSNLFRSPGDWICPSCGFSNFAWRKECLRCSSVSNIPAANGYLPLPAHAAPQSTTSYHDNRHVNTANDTTFETIHHTVHGNENKAPGLSTSRWAPRNYRGRTNSDEIWTRTVPKPPQVTPSSTPKPPELGLPYEVQHYILAMMQRILEEACYDLASRWIPQKLRDNRWDCPEAVELSTWRDLLPTTLPPNAIVPSPSYPLERALVDAVQIRNAAVHRHLCDNTEIRRMAVKARDIMEMFRDVTRRNKFHRLWIELNDWDQSSDQQAAREKLLLALREISERPVDDMDWTPNSVSLQEVTNVVPVESGHDEYHGEEMDLD